MRAAIVLLTGLVGVRASSTDAHYVDVSLDVDGRLLSWRFVDLEGDGARELVVAVLAPSGERELHVHRLGKDRLEPEPTHVVPVLDDVLAWGAADVRSEPGRELVFLTRAGAWSYSLTLPGYKNNVRPLARTDLIYDLPDPRALPHWRYILPRAEGDLVLLPGRDGFAVWGPSDEQDAPYELRAAFDALEVDEHGDEVRADRKGDGIRFDVGGSSPFVRDDDTAAGTLLEDALAYRAPALVDVDGDGFLDVVLAREGALALHLGGPDGPPEQVTRFESFPAELVPDEEEKVELTLVDLDGDGDLDVLGHVREDVDGFENAAHRLFLYRNDGRSLLRDVPDQVLRFEAAVLPVEVADVDGDGRVDLTMRKLELPSLVGTVTGLEFKFSYLVYLGERRGFARKPALKQEETYDEESVVEIAANRELAFDCDGDGVADLVEVDLEGRIAIRRLRKESSMLRGDSWKLEPAPWKRFPSAGSIQSLKVMDLNGDGLGDIVSASAERLTVLLSARGGGR